MTDANISHFRAEYITIFFYIVSVRFPVNGRHNFRVV